MDIRHLETVMAVGESGSFTGAALKLRTVQSNVSEHIRSLERELGGELFSRGRKGAVPTELGELVIERGRRIFAEMTALRSDADALQTLDSGEVTLGTVGTISRWLVPRLATALRLVAPRLKLHFVEASSERLAELVVGQHISQAVLTLRVDDPRLEAEQLLEEDLVAIVAPDFPGDGAITIGDLSKWPMVLPPATSPLRKEVADLAISEGAELFAPVEVDGIRLITDLVASGEFVSIVPELALRHDPSRVKRLRVLNAPSRRVGIVRAKGSRLSIANEVVRQHIVDIATNYQSE